MKILLVTTDYDLINNARTKAGYSVMSTTTMAGATDLLKEHGFDMIVLGTPYCDLPDIGAGLKKKYKQVVKIRGKEFTIPAGDEKTAVTETPAAESRHPTDIPKQQPAQTSVLAQDRVQQIQTTEQPKQPKQPETKLPAKTVQTVPQKPEEPVRTEPITAGSTFPSDLLRNCQQILLISQNRETIVAVRHGPYGEKITVAVSQASAKQILSKQQADLVIFGLDEQPAFNYGCRVLYIGRDLSLDDLSTGGMEPTNETAESGQANSVVKTSAADVLADKASCSWKNKQTDEQAAEDSDTPATNTPSNQILMKYDMGPEPLVFNDTEDETSDQNTNGFDQVLKHLTFGARKLSEAAGSIAQNLRFGRKPEVQKIYQHVIGITGTKGGLGRTTLALDIARWLSRDANVLLLDLNFQVGGSDLPYMAGVGRVPNLLTFRSEKNLLEAVQDAGGISILSSPPCNASDAKIEPAEIEFIVREGLKNFNTIIIDLPPGDDGVCDIVRHYVTATVIMTGGGGSEINRLLKKAEQWPRPVVVVHGKNEAKAEKFVGSVPCWLLPHNNSQDYKSVIAGLTESIVTTR